VRLDGYEQLGYFDMSLQEDGAFGIDPDSLHRMDEDHLNLNVFDDQGLGVAGLTGFDPDMQDATASRSTPVVIGEDTQVIAVELTPQAKTAAAVVGGIAIGFLISAALRR